MISIAYTLTPLMQDDLSVIDKLYRNILLTPIPLFVEQQLRWKARCDEIMGSLFLADRSVSLAAITHVFLHPSRHPTVQEKHVLAYNNALDIIRSDWTGSTKPLTPSHIGAIALIAEPSNHKQVMRALTASEHAMTKALAYIGSQKDHPIILAGVLYGLLMDTPIGVLTNGLVPRLAFRMILAKYGYDCRAMLTLAPAWSQHSDSHKKARQTIITEETLTNWLAHIIKSAIPFYQELLTAIQSSHALGTTAIKQFAWRLNEREERILRQLENPEIKITNKTAQRLFRISAVTASRDLARLAALGLILPHGKGRSVYYTKA